MQLMSAITKAKSVVTTAARTERRVVRVQRRIWLAQMLLWPTLLVTAAAGGAWLIASRRRTEPAPVSPAADIQLP